jgi:LGFP repeat/Divergent InlB B-repeat domain
MTMNKRPIRCAPLLCSLAACAAPTDQDAEEDGLAVLADQAPFGQISIEAHAQPPQGGSATVSVSSLGTVACTGAVCFSSLFSTPTFTATANAGWHFVQWTGCSAAGANATVTLGATTVDERCTALFEADPPPPATAPTPPVTAPPPAEPPPQETVPPLPPALPPMQPEPDHVVPADHPPWMPQKSLQEKFDSLPSELQAGLGQQLRGFTNCDQIPNWNDRYSCWFTEYEFGRIYTQQNGQTTEIHGAIYEAWLSDPWNNPTNSFPNTDETATPDGRGRWSAANAHFYWTPETGAWSVHWWAHVVWRSIGIGNPAWGYPTGAYFSDDDGTYCPKSPSNARIAQPFEGGWVCADWDRAWVIPY